MIEERERESQERMLAYVAKFPECCDQSKHHRRLELGVLSGIRTLLPLPASVCRLTSFLLERESVPRMSILLAEMAFQ